VTTLSAWTLWRALGFLHNVLCPLCQPPSQHKVSFSHTRERLLENQTCLCHATFTALTCICSQVEGNVTVYETIFLEFIFIVEVIDFKFLQVTRGLGSLISLNTLDGEIKIKTRVGTSLVGAQGK
jgi:hypothetical protein